jgi:endo-1,4-beta-xylanase
MDMSRRDLAVALMMLPANVRASQTDRRSLRNLAANRNIIFGSMITQRDIGDTAYAALLTEQCAIITPGLEAKWAVIEPHNGIFNFAPMDELAIFAEAGGLKLHMHNLIWSVALPKWTLEALASGQGPGIMARHIATVAGHYRGRVQSWDVINEAVDPRWPADRTGVLTTPWWHGVGPDFIVDAFAEAATADPTAQLMINDDDLEYDTPDREAKRTNYLRLIETWLRRGVQIHAFGLETHFKPWLPFAEKPYRRFLREVAGFGLKLRITEFDINDRLMPADVVRRDVAVADCTKRFLDVALDEPALDMLIVWGLTDRATWMQWDPAGRRQDGLAPRPSPYDAHLMPKPMCEAIAGALRAARARPA